MSLHTSQILFVYIAVCLGTAALFQAARLNNFSKFLQNFLILPRTARMDASKQYPVKHLCFTFDISFLTELVPLTLRRLTMQLTMK